MRRGWLPPLLLVLVVTSHGNSDEAEETCDVNSQSGSCKASTPQTWQDLQFSVVLPCADEGEFAAKTVRRIHERTPEAVLKEIVVVDDGSQESIQSALEAAGMDEVTRASMKVRLLRHTKTLGLMAAKKTGGDNATGDVITFLDCHVAPQTGWTEQIAQLIFENPKRMVVPLITDIDIDTWDEKVQSASNSKCYLTWDPDFKWYNDDTSPYIPIMSGGLLALSNHWWQQTGGYDEHMRGWGGENIDQSLRGWLCGGEIMRAARSRVAHMWRTQDPRTRPRFRMVGGGQNLPRVVAAWFDAFKKKARYPESHVARMDVSNIEEVKKRLQCKPFVWFLWRFREIYEGAGILAPEVFQLRDKLSGLCLGREGQVVKLLACAKGARNQMLHGANWASATRKCCSGLRFWNSDGCLDAVQANGPIMYACDVAGNNLNQRYHLAEDGKLKHRRPELQSDSCLTVAPGDDGSKRKLVSVQMPCGADTSTFEKVWAFEPEETSLYREQLRLHKIG
eukprot:TRINITY_DN51349_c0_g1_i1.p1 TRINITY_DN51349_c0_g1~~TRINITY_DN51349_c0_g1_i1.p1  ORF type:complete len:507 (+),score=121.13 TRINITY_DN51349_c0_g1_i1:91-1611(+)